MNNKLITKLVDDGITIERGGKMDGDTEYDFLIILLEPDEDIRNYNMTIIRDELISRGHTHITVYKIDVAGEYFKMVYKNQG